MADTSILGTPVRNKRGKITARVLVDIDDVDLCNLVWYLQRPGYLVNDKRSGERLMHRVIMVRKLGRPMANGECVDHINGDALDNRRENLRAVSHKQNMENRKLHKNNQSGFRGVSWIPKGKCWRARVCHNGVGIHLGRFKNIEDAAAAAQAKRDELGYLSH